MLPSARNLAIRAEFPIGSTVFLRSRVETLPGMVTGLFVRPTGLMYLVGWGDATESSHFEFELSADGFDDESGDDFDAE